MNNNQQVMNVILQMMKNGNNPTAIINQLMNQIPEVKSLMTQVQNSGMPIEQYARQYFKQQGVNVEQYVNQLRRSGFKI